MPATPTPGPYRVIERDGLTIPWYMIPFDERGRCTGPATQQHLLDTAKAGGFSDVYLFSHGWNNTWKDATDAYQRFLDGYMQMRKDNALPAAPNYKPLLIGIFWPSIILVTEDEKAPQIAAEGMIDDAAILERREVERLTLGLPDDQAARFYQLTQQAALTAAETVELGRMLTSVAGAAGDDPIADSPAAEMGGVENIVAALVARAGAPAPADSGPRDLSDFGSAVAGASSTPAGTGTGPQAASWLGDQIRRILPRDAIRVFTVYQMKDRAGVVGARGVAPLLTALLENTTARIHLIGHSYGGKVVMSATCFPSALSRPVDSLLLLQPAVSHLCFAANLPGRRGPGGFRTALERVRLPILSTYSAHDFPLTQVFQYALRRGDDVGELKIAAAGEPPNMFAALGGFGPRGAGEKLVDIIPDTKTRYTLDAAGPRIYGLDATATIDGHGGVINLSTWWALYNLVSS